MTEVYAFPTVSAGNGETSIVDVMSNGDGTYIAYIDYKIDGIIQNRFIFTLEHNTYPMYSSKYKFNYTIVAAIIIE